MGFDANIDIAATHHPHRKIPLINIGFTQTKPTQKNILFLGVCEIGMM
jgi:hypothetical protein